MMFLLNKKQQSISVTNVVVIFTTLAVIVLSCVMAANAFSLGGSSSVAGREDPLSSESDTVDQLASSGLSKLLDRKKRALFGGPSGDSGLELCKIFKNKSVLASVDEVCHRCYELFRKENLHIQCRAKCYNNEIFEECARVVLQGDLIDARQKYL